jgi:hypothetical protein
MNKRHLVHITVKQVTIILCIKCHNMVKTINMNHSYYKTHLPWSYQLTAVSCIFWMVQILCDGIHRHVHITVSFSHTVYLTYKEFLLISLSLSQGTSWYSAILHFEWQDLIPSCISSNAPKQVNAWPPAMQWVQCWHQLPTEEFYFSDA